MPDREQQKQPVFVIPAFQIRSRSFGPVPVHFLDFWLGLMVLGLIISLLFPEHFGPI